MQIRWIGAIAALLLVLGGSPVVAQTSADAFFHEAAQQYVIGDVAAARQTVERGLEVAPSNPRLLALRKKLRQREGRNGGGRSSQRGRQGQQRNEQSRGRRTQGNRQGDSERDARSRAEEGAQSDRSSQRSKRDQSSEQRGEEATRQGEKRNRGNGRPRTNALSRAQAERLLRALENQEKKLLREIRVRTGEEKTVEKDW